MTDAIPAFGAAARRVDPPARVCAWHAAPRPGLILPFALPAAMARRPQIAHGLGAADPGRAPDPDMLRAERLFWPVPRHDALRAEGAVILGAPGAARGLMAAARAALGPRAVAVGTGRAARVAARDGWTVVPDLASIRPGALAQVVGAPGDQALFWAALAGLDALACTEEGALRPVDPAPWAARLAWSDPWTGAPTDMSRGLDAAIAFHRAAEGNDRPAITVGFTRWKRRCVGPFLDGPAGGARHVRGIRAARRLAARTGGRIVLWGVEPPGQDDALRLEDGFVRSGGLGVGGTPPASLAVARHGLHFDCTRIGDLERAALGDAPPALLARAARLRARLVAACVCWWSARSRTTHPCAAARRGCGATPICWPRPAPIGRTRSSCGARIRMWKPESGRAR